jgi:hypothetical protein
MSLEDFYFGLIVVASAGLLAWILDLFMDSLERKDNE